MHPDRGNEFPDNRDYRHDEPLLTNDATRT